MTRFVQICVTLCSLLFAQLAAAEALVIGTLSDSIRNQIDHLTPLARYLEVKLKETGVTEVQIRVLSNSKQMALALAGGQVDLFIDSPLVIAKVAQESGATPFLRRWKEGVSSYHSVIVVPTDSPIETLRDLAGRRIGMEGVDSTSGFMLPALMIDAEGLTLEKLRNRTFKPASNNVGYLFTAADKNTAFWLVMGWVDAAATDYHSFLALNDARPGQFRVLASSPDVPRQVVSHRPDLAPELVAAISQVLIDMNDTKTGDSILKTLHNTRCFDLFPAGAAATFAPIFAMLDRFEDLGLN